ncbi:MAG: FG-GAP-like repeat-containing protein [Candidatus Latescibacterota bacterium]
MALGPGLADSAAAEPWRILVLRCEYPREAPDEPTTTGTGGFDLRPASEALAEYRYPFDLPPHDRVYFESHLEGLANYYRTVSGGRVEIQFEVYPRERGRAYLLPETALHYGNGRTEEEIGGRWVELLADALALAEADPTGPRFDEFNSFLVFHAGVGGETGQLNDVRSVFLDTLDLERHHGGPLQAGGVQVRQGWILPESPSLDGRAGLNGLLAKFFGHQLGLPGLSNFAAGVPALGGWSLMDVGVTGVGFVRQDSLMPVIGFVPPLPEAWSRAFLGWTEPLVVRRDTTVSLRAADRSGVGPEVLRLPLDGQESLWLENRQQRGQRGVHAGTQLTVARYDSDAVVWLDQSEVHLSEENRVWTSVDEYDAFVPGSGILVWRVDDAVVQDRLGSGTINNEPVHPGIALVEADGYRDVGYASWERYGAIEGSPEDAFFAGGTNVLGPDTYPDTKTYQGWSSGVRVEVLSPPGDLMEVRVSFPRSVAGWPRPAIGGQRLQAADLDGDGRSELVAQTADGVRVFGADGRELLRLDQARLLAIAARDAGPGAGIYVTRDGAIEAWAPGATEPAWSYPVEWTLVCGLVADLGLFPDHRVLAVGGEELILLDAADGAILGRQGLRATALLAADLDGDEIVDLGLAGPEGLWRFTGTDPVQLGAETDLLSPAAGDLDGDGLVEVVTVSPDGTIRVRRQESEIWRLSVGDSLVAGPVLGDLDGDGRLEIVLSGIGRVHALRADGIRQADFPARLPGLAGTAQLAGAPVLLDLDNDGRQEILVGTGQGIFGLDQAGDLLAGFPLLAEGAVIGSPAAADLDADGTLELAGLAGDWLYAWRPEALAPSWTPRSGDWLQAGRGSEGTYAHLRTDPVPVPDPQADLLPAERAYCWPNPVTGSDQAHLRFFLGRPGQVRLEVYDPAGHRMGRYEAATGLTAPAEHEIAFSISGWASGLYLCRLVAEGETGGRDAVVVKMAVSR